MICRSKDAGGRLNTFQRLMLQWSELHPYNAVHVYKIARPLAVEALADAIVQTHRAAGIGSVVVDTDSLYYCHGTDDTPEVELVQDCGDPELALANQLTRELNRPFERPRCKPWRFSVVSAEPDAHYVITTYDHWIADSVAARLVSRQVLDRYCEWNVPANRRPPDLYPGTYREVFSHRLRGIRLLGSGVNSFRQWLRNRRVVQVPYTSGRQMDVRFELYRAASGTIPKLRHFARSQGATIHDVILAALGRAMTEFLPRRAVRNRRRLSLGTIVDTRGEAQEDLSESLGTFLSHYLVQLAADKTMSLAEATQRIALATGPIKAQRAYLDSLVSTKLASGLWPYATEKAKPFFMRGALPMTAGVSNVVIRDGWMKSCGAGCVTEYIRGAPAGPILPLVLSPTTLGEEMNVGVTYRTAGFPQQRIDGVMEMFMNQIEHSTEVRRSPRHRHANRPAMLAPAAARRSPAAVSCGR